MADYEIADLKREELLLVITSTFGNGDPPENGKVYYYDKLAILSANIETKLSPSWIVVTLPHG